MSSLSYKKSLQEVLDAEKKAENDIQRAMDNKKRHIQQEREKLYAEIDNFKREETKKKDDEINKLLSNKEMDESLKKSHLEGITHIENDFKKNKNKAIDYLLNTLLTVDLSIPDVVIGKFAHKILNTNLNNKKK